MWETNPDGAGYAYVSHGQVHYRKGFMTLEVLKEDLHTQAEFLRGVEFAIHFRIGTAGRNDAYTTHPFPISTNFGDLRHTEGEASAVLFHNGILSDGGITDPHASDTQDFVIATAPLLARPSHSRARDAFIEDSIIGSRLLIMYGDGTVKRYGDWQEDGNLYVSNTYYQCRATTTNDEMATTQRILEEVRSKSYAATTPEELKALKACATETTPYVMFFPEQALGYDQSSGYVWAATAEEYDTKRQEEYDAIYG